MNKVLNTDLYGKSMCQWFQKKFPKIIIPTGDNLVDILSGLLYSSKENRLGPIPAVEHQVTVRDVIREAIASHERIPILIPWGGRKAGSRESIDVAEISAVLQIVELNNTIQKFYKPGLLVHFVMEDTGALYMWKNDDDIYPVIQTYTQDMQKLVFILRDDAEFIPIAESSVMSFGNFNIQANRYSPLIYSVLQARLLNPEGSLDDNEAFRTLTNMGWHGDFPIEQIEYYTNRYKVLYPENTGAENLSFLADYFAQSKARYDLDGKCAPDNLSSGRYIKLSFSPQIPGINNFHSNSIYWRTIPLSQARTHIQPWRGMGYFQIKDAGNTVKSKICSPHDPKVVEFIPSVTTLKNNDLVLNINTPYILED